MASVFGRLGVTVTPESTNNRPRLDIGFLVSNTSTVAFTPSLPTIAHDWTSIFRCHTPSLPITEATTPCNRHARSNRAGRIGLIQAGLSVQYIAPAEVEYRRAQHWEDHQRATTIKLESFSSLSKVALIRKVWSYQIPDQSFAASFLLVSYRLIRKKTIDRKFELVQLCKSDP